MPAPEKAALRKALRKEKIKAREALTPQERAEKSRSICAFILQTPEWKRAKTVMIYKFVKGEVQLKALEEANEALPEAERKTLLYPLCIEDRGNRCRSRAESPRRKTSISWSAPAAPSTGRLCALAWAAVTTTAICPNARRRT